MSADLFLNLEGIHGNSRKKNHAGDIDILSWDWEKEDPGAKGPSSDKGFWDTITITKLFDSTSAILSRDGASFESGAIIGEGDGRQIMRMELTQIAVSNFGYHGTPTAFYEVIRLYAKVTVHYMLRPVDAVETAKRAGDSSN